MAATLTARKNRLANAKSSTEVEAMLRDIATVLRLTAIIKADMQQEQTEAKPAQPTRLSRAAAVRCN